MKYFTVLWFLHSQVCELNKTFRWNLFIKKCVFIDDYPIYIHIIHIYIHYILYTYVYTHIYIHIDKYIIYIYTHTQVHIYIHIYTRAETSSVEKVFFGMTCILESCQSIHFDLRFFVIVNECAHVVKDSNVWLVKQSLRNFLDFTRCHW